MRKDVWELWKVVHLKEQEGREARERLSNFCDKLCTCSSWRLSTFYGEHSESCPLVMEEGDGAEG